MTPLNDTISSNWNIHIQEEHVKKKRGFENQLINYY